MFNSQEMHRSELVDRRLEAGGWYFWISSPYSAGCLNFEFLDLLVYSRLHAEALEAAFNALLDTLRPLLGPSAQPTCAAQGKAILVDL